MANPELGIIQNLVPFLLIFVVFYFIVIKPQNSKLKEQQNMLSNLKIGDNILTSFGVIGKITKISHEDQFVEIEISNNVNIKIEKSRISSLFKN